MSLLLQEPAASPARSHSACGTCGLRSLCLALCGAETEPPGLALDRRRLEPGEALYQKGDKQTSLYSVRAGFLKTCAVLPDGERRVLGYHILGDLLGLDALGAGIHPTETVALTSCEVCAIPMERADRVLAAQQPIATRLRGVLSDQIARGEEHMVSLGSFSARQRVAVFLLDLSERWAVRGYSANRFDLCLTRKEIGSYLGLTFETVSRTLSHFAARRWIEVAGREIHILDSRALEAQALAA